MMDMKRDSREIKYTVYGDEVVGEGIAERAG